jgi:hypothetical protein
MQFAYFFRERGTLRPSWNYLNMKGNHDLLEKEVEKRDAYGYIDVGFY